MTLSVGPAGLREAVHHSAASCCGGGPGSGVACRNGSGGLGGSSAPSPESGRRASSIRATCSHARPRIPTVRSMRARRRRQAARAGSPCCGPRGGGRFDLAATVDARPPGEGAAAAIATRAMRSRPRVAAADLATDWAARQARCSGKRARGCSVPDLDRRRRVIPETACATRRRSSVVAHTASSPR